MEQGSTTRDANGTELFAGEAWFDPIEACIRDRLRGFIQELKHDLCLDRPGVQQRRGAFLRRWRMRCPAVASSLEEAGH